MTAFPFILLTLAVWRVVRLYQTDTISKPLREKVNQRLMFSKNKNVVAGDGSRSGRIRLWLIDLLSCQWCLGVWVAFGMLGVTWAATDLSLNAWSYIVVALALSGTQSFVHIAEDILEGLVDWADDQ